MKEKLRPGFHPSIEIPEVPMGMVLVKFHGQPALIPEKGDEPLVGKSPFTKRQVDALMELEAQRKQREERQAAISESVVY